MNSTSPDSVAAPTDKAGYCSLCRANFLNGKRHFFTQTHAANVQRLLSRQKEKNDGFRQHLRNVLIITDSTKQPDTWCLFCDSKIKASIDFVPDFHIYCIHIFEHWASASHLKALKRWLYTHKIDMSRLGEFSLTAERLDEFHCIARLKLAQQPPLKKPRVSSPTHPPDPQLVGRLDQTSTLKPATAGPSSAIHLHGTGAADASVSNRPISSRLDPSIGLARIVLPSGSQGPQRSQPSIPPWLQDEPVSSDDGQAPACGPSIVDYLLHKQHEAARRLNPNRVGANQTFGGDVGDDWLPNFGRVWNSGKRSETAREFRDEKRKRNRGPNE
ncbi:coiled coil protein 84-domain-containing protein [Polychytrium aggregatum]|uniref:coiled coil protein 84-domain-containing protein n=1 Tax=Polychytrium aggregatum TaxID=110093 RepID=UPI0022FEA995|nr:coiled coil protein 84-domain-containing protein [Polychytrium aggregatum]KAI9197263.1 coiled coil protein 84-domain-containing protein [Polychytrium aggregatum]